MTIACAVCMFALLAFSDAAMAAALEAARCFAAGVMPALLPMMVLGRMLPAGRGKPRSFIRLWIRAGAFAFAAGSPASAQRAAEMRAEMNPARWEKLLCLTGVMSPMFFTGMLAGWLGSAREGWVLLGIHWLGAVLTALIWPARWGENTSEVRYETPMRMSLPEAIAQSAHSLLCVCGAMMVFSVAACLVKSVLAALFPVWTAQHAGWLALLWGVMEIGGGSSAVIQAYEKPQALLSALCGFGGMSIWLQNLLFLGQNVRPAKLLFMRTVHGAVCYAIVSLIRPF